MQIVLILINAFFAATEIAVISLNENKLRKQAEDGDKKSLKMLKLVSEPTGFLSTIQIGITLAGFLASAFAAENFSERLSGWIYSAFNLNPSTVSFIETLSLVLTTLILSYFTLIFGELVPKRVAMRNSEKLARAVSPAVLFIASVLKPVVWFMTVSTNAVLRLMGINPKESDEVVSEEDIRMMIDIGEEKGTIESNEKEMIENIFEFNNITAADVMIHRTAMVSVWEEDSEDEIIDTILTSGYSRFPVFGEDTDDVIGILITREFLLNLREEKPKTIRELVKPAYFVPESIRADILFKNMQKLKVQMAIVVDEYGGTAGLVTMEDLIEEIVGNIYDESDCATDDQQITHIDDNLWRIAGSTTIEEINEALGTDIETEEYNTLGGLIFGELEQIPPDGAKPKLTACGLNISVEEILDRHVKWATVSKVIEPEEKTQQ